MRSQQLDRDLDNLTHPSYASKCSDPCCFSITLMTFNGTLEARVPPSFIFTVCFNSFAVCYPCPTFASFFIPLTFQWVNLQEIFFIYISNLVSNMAMGMNEHMYNV